MDKNKTRVIFLLEKDSKEVFAYFPDVDYSFNKTLKVCYSHIGQHSSCHEDYAKECELAKYYLYQDLLRELTLIGYNLEVDNFLSETIEYHRNPTAYEIKFGEGDLHYKDFTLKECFKKGYITKKWLICKDDGLRYYY